MVAEPRYEKYAFINLKHPHTLEFRLCKFVNAKQFKELQNTIELMVKCIFTNYINKGCTYEAAARTSKRLVKIYKDAVKHAESGYAYRRCI